MCGASQRDSCLLAGGLRRFRNRAPRTRRGRAERDRNRNKLSLSRRREGQKEWRDRAGRTIDNDRSVHPGDVGWVITARPNRTELLKCKLIGVRLTKQPPGGSRTSQGHWSGFWIRDPHPYCACACD